MSASVPAEASPAAAQPPVAPPVALVRVGLAALWLYAAALVLPPVLQGHFLAVFVRWASWVAVPAQLITLLGVGLLIAYVPMTRARRWGWLFLVIALVIDLALTLGWTFFEPDRQPILQYLALAVYQAFYPLSSAACIAFYLSIGGSFRRSSAWLDAATVLFGVWATLWAIFYESPGALHAAQAVSLQMKLAYVFCIGLSMSMTGLLFTQISHWRDAQSVSVVACAMVIAMVTDVAWLARASGTHALPDAVDALGEIVFGAGDALYYALIGTAVLLEYGGTRRGRVGAVEPSDSLSPLPILTLMLATTLFIAAEASRRGVGERVLIGLLVAGSLLLVARQRAVGAEIRRLNRALAMREAEARLTELVRCSADVIAVVDRTLTLTFVSPAAAQVLERSPDVLLGHPAKQLLGAAHAPALTQLLARLLRDEDAVEQIELATTSGAGEPRWLRLTCRNQLHNALIGGITLTLTDVSEQRHLEREVLNAASHERQRLSSEIHEGLGQELTGIAMLLQSASSRTRRESASVSSLLESLASHVSRAIATSRQLATGLSPLTTVRGSLGAGLRHLAAETGTRLPVRIECQLNFPEERVDDATADYVYRIVQEAISNALRHGNATEIDVALRSVGDHLALTVTSNGNAPAPEHGRRAGLGLRMIDYRVRLLGGEVSFGPGDGGGAALAIRIPLRITTATEP